MIEALADRFRKIAPDVDFWSVRFVRGQEESLSARQGIIHPPLKYENEGAMVTIHDRGGMGYGASSDLTEEGLRRSLDEALLWARRSAGRMVRDIPAPQPVGHVGEHSSPVGTPWGEVLLKEKIWFLKELNERLNLGEKIVERFASLFYVEEEVCYINSVGARVRQRFSNVIPYMGAVASVGSESQRRTNGGRGFARQGGWDAAHPEKMLEAAPVISEEAEQLLSAPNCPDGRIDLILAPDQMILQIHESIGHPLEIDRILGDERNYAGTSFVTLDDFGKYRYGSNLLNVVFDPGETGQLASYSFDDDGTPAAREHLIRDGILLRGLGGAVSQMRSGVPGVACSRAVGWNRPPIDRMANINIEPGDSGLDEMIASVERGVFMKTNCSWSIDDSRLKFQFGCEWARLIENGEMTGVVKNPNYRGMTPEFWRNLKAVGNLATYEILGTPNCGKGEPNQMIRVGHATPVCLFGGIEVFGGESA